MTDQFMNTTVEILGKHYAIRCPESNQNELQAAARYLNKKMQEIQESGKAINLERIAIMAALNITYEFLNADQQKQGLVNQVNKRILNLQEKLDQAIQYAE